MSFFQKLQQGANDLARDFNKGVQDATDKAKQKWQDVQVQCPNCQVMLTVPPPPEGAPAAPVFQCGQCGTQISRPTAVSTLAHHGDKLGDQLKSAFNQATNQQTTIQIQVPANAKAGDTIFAQAAPGAPQFTCCIPAGAQPGQFITVAVPANCLPAAPRTATTSATPTAVPVATPVGGASASGEMTGVPESAAPAAAAPTGAYGGAVVTGVPVEPSANEKK